MKIGFVVFTYNETPIIKTVYDELIKKGHECYIISLDKFEFHKASDGLKKQGLEFLELQNNLEYNWFTATWFQRMRLHRHAVKQFRQILEEKGGDVFVFGNDGNCENFIINFLKRKNIPTVLIQHGLIMRAKKIKRITPRIIWRKMKEPIWKSNIFKFFLIGNFRFAHSNIDTICVYGKSAKEILKERGIRESKIIITGAPQYEILASQLSETEKDAIRHFFKISKDKKVVLFTAQPLSKYYPDYSLQEELIDNKAIIGNLLLHDDIITLYKFHPQHNISVFTDAFQEFLKHENFRLTATEFSSQDLLQISDYLITIGSTTSYEALLLGKPIILIKYLQQGYELDLSPASFTINAPDELKMLGAKNFFENLELDEQARNSIMLEHLNLDASSKESNKAARRIADLIISLKNP